jgi:hypothetical protein
MVPAHQPVGPTFQVDRLVGPAHGTHCQGWLVGPGCLVGWWDLAIRLKFTNLNGHIDMTRRRIAEVLV